MHLPSWIRQHLAAVRALLVLTVLTGVLYPLAVTAVAQIPGLRDQARGSMIDSGGHPVGSRLVGQGFVDNDGNPLKQYFQSRPSAAGKGWDPTATSASNLGPESVVDTLPDPAKGGHDDNAKQSLLTQVCARSKAVGDLEGVSGARPYCTPGGVGAVLAVIGTRDSRGQVVDVRQVVSLNEQCPATPFLASYRGVAVTCATYGQDYSAGQVVPIRGDAPAAPDVPADAVTASASGLDPDISPAYAQLQARRIATTRHVEVSKVLALIDQHTTGRALGFMGEPHVNVLELNLDLDRDYPLTS
jgi:K+-transporting ATPase ATPase C chain